MDLESMPNVDQSNGEVSTQQESCASSASTELGGRAFSKRFPSSSRAAPPSLRNRVRASPQRVRGLGAQVRKIHSTFHHENLLIKAQRISERVAALKSQLDCRKKEFEQETFSNPIKTAPAESKRFELELRSIESELEACVGEAKHWHTPHVQTQFIERLSTLGTPPDTKGQSEFYNTWNDFEKCLVATTISEANRLLIESNEVIDRWSQEKSAGKTATEEEESKIEEVLRELKKIPLPTPFNMGNVESKLGTMITKLDSLSDSGHEQCTSLREEWEKKRNQLDLLYHGEKEEWSLLEKQYPLGRESINNLPSEGVKDLIRALKRRRLTFYGNREQKTALLAQLGHRYLEQKLPEIEARVTMIENSGESVLIQLKSFYQLSNDFENLLQESGGRTLPIKETISNRIKGKETALVNQCATESIKKSNPAEKSWKNFFLEHFSIKVCARLSDAVNTKIGEIRAAERVQK